MFYTKMYEWGRRGTRIGCWWERCHWEDQDVEGLDNVRMDLVEVGWGDVDMIGVLTTGDLRVVLSSMELVS
jgi:hypothetical protein